MNKRRFRRKKAGDGFPETIPEGKIVPLSDSRDKRDNFSVMKIKKSIDIGKKVQDLRERFNVYLKNLLGIDMKEVEKIRSELEREEIFGIEVGGSELKWGFTATLGHLHLEDIALLIYLFKKFGLEEGRDYVFTSNGYGHFDFSYVVCEEAEKALELHGKYIDAQRILFDAKTILEMNPEMNVEQILSFANKMSEIREKLFAPICPKCGTRALATQTREELTKNYWKITVKLPCKHQITKKITFKKKDEN